MKQYSPLGEIIIELNDIDSTNNYAMRLINEGMAEHGLAIRADFQSKGKGQLGNIWLAEESKNLLCSIIIDTKGFELESQFVFNCMTCVAITEMLMQQYNIPNVQIKWPNDIYAGNRKIAGILIENNIRGISWTNAIVGIGLNINQTEFSYLKTATSLKILLNKDLKINVVFKLLLKKLNRKFSELLKNEQKILDQYNMYLMDIDKKIQYNYKYNLREGILLGVNNLGQIMIQEEGKNKAYNHKEIELLIE